MAVIWGLDLHEMQWGKFKSSYMFKNNDYHLRRTKFIAYQCAMILCVVSESLGTAVLSDYIDQQNYLQGRFPTLSVFNDDYVGIASYNIFVGVAIATVFGAGFFFDLFWPLRHEPSSIQWAWQGSAVFLTVAGLADALAYTVIVSQRGLVFIGGESLDQVQGQNLLQLLAQESKETPILYRDGGRAIASVVLLWLGWAATVVSTIVMILFYKHVRTTGTAKAQHAINKERSFADNAENVNAVEESKEEAHKDSIAL